MVIQEDLQATWDKRFKASHYSYRDFHRATALILTEVQATALFLLGNATAYYTFGTNARAKLNPLTNLPYNLIAWPTSCYGRKIVVYCDQNAWISIVSVNPEYVRQATVGALTGATPTAPMLIAEEEQLIPAGSLLTFYPTYGYGVIFRADAVQGTISFWIEGNNEGGE